MLYIWIISLIFYRYTFFTMHPSDLAPPYWINMGAVAISTLAGSLLVLASPPRMAEAKARAGVADGTIAVVYDDTLSYHASRAWWSLRAYGFEAARVLDGGFPAWLEAHLATVDPYVPTTDQPDGVGQGAPPRLSGTP